MNATPPPAFPASADRARPPEHTLDSTDLEEPPPYTPRPSTWSGETTVEQGPSRPFQPAPQTLRPPVTTHPTGISSFSSSAGSLNRSAGSLLTQLATTLTNTVNAAVNNLNSPPPPQPYRPTPSWTSYPGQRQEQQQQPPPTRPPRNFLTPPPRHPSSFSPSPSTGSRSPSSDFARDFYAAGPLGESNVANNSTTVYSPPPGSPPRIPPRPPHPNNASTSSSLTPNDGRPTTHPSLGHPLLKDGKLLVYPKGYECSKCHNIGYKNADPLRPCKKCWSKYAKPFAGPLVYSFSPSNPNPNSDSTDRPAENFQRPLPHPPPPQAPPIPPALSFNPPPAHFAPGGYMTDHHGGFYSPPTGVHPTQTRIGRDIVDVSGRPPPGSVVYTAGDPRIGGRLCWRCDGKGNTSYMILDRITCPVCGGVGRTFD